MKISRPLFAAFLFLCGQVAAVLPAHAQRAVQSPLMVTVVRNSSSRTTQQMGLKITIRNMSKNDVDVRLEALFLASGGSRGNQDGIYCERKTSATLKPSESREFETESEQPNGSSYTYNGNYYYYSSMKVRGYMTRVFADGQLVNVTGSAPSFQKAGWDDKEMAKLGYSGPGPSGEASRPAGREEPAEVAGVTATPRPGQPGVAAPAMTAPARTGELASRVLQSGLRRDIGLYFSLDEQPEEGIVRAANNSAIEGLIMGRISAQPCIGSALCFGPNAVVHLGHPDCLDFAGPVTMSAWVRNDDPDLDHRSVLSRGGGAGDMFIRIREGRYQIGSRDGNAEYLAAAPVPAGDLGAWVHLAGTYDGASWRLYHNGQPLAENPAQRGALMLAAAWHIGADDRRGLRGFAGAIDEVGIWKRALGAEEVSALHEAGRLRMADAARRPARAETATAAAPVPRPAAAPAQPESAPTARPEPMPAAPTAATPPTFDAKIYERTAKLFNDSVDAYQSFLRTRTNPAVLKKIENDLHACTEEFAKIENGAPASLDIPGLLIKCRQMIFAVHSTMQAQP